VDWLTPESVSDAEVTKLMTTPERVARIENETPALAGASAMELAGLEPATSWVRSRRSPN
jgi:hypothetical protein